MSLWQGKWVENETALRCETREKGGTAKLKKTVCPPGRRDLEGIGTARDAGGGKIKCANEIRGSGSYISRGGKRERSSEKGGGSCTFGWNDGRGRKG